MGLTFDKLPVNTLVGADWQTFKALTDGQHIGDHYKGKFRLTKAVCRLLSTLVPIENRAYNKIAGQPLQEDPLFILGHWRSGTTFVHNVFACDKHFGYTTTYQTVFPHLVLWGQPFFKKNMAMLMPDKRPTDNMELRPDLPQEEEFALSNMMPYTYYNFWFFPERWMEYCDRFLTFEKITEEERQVFKDTFLRLVKVSLANTGGTQYLSKNPPHTGRVRTLLEMFPNAKFIYLKRNPYTVFESTRSFFTNTIKPLQLQDISQEQIVDNIVEAYMRLYNRYEADKLLIPEGNLVEIKFEDFDHNAFAPTKEIYGKLKLQGFNEAEADIRAYLDKNTTCQDEAIAWMVETSSNVASVMTDENSINIVASQRSNVMSNLENMTNTVKAAFLLAGAEVTVGDKYPAWKMRANSELTDLAVKAYEKLFGKKPLVKGIHAGLECGLFSERYPELDMVSFGPTLRNVHTPDEALLIPTVEMVWNHLLEILRSVAK